MSARRLKTVIFADAARADLVEIARFIARDNPARARSVSANLKAKALGLLEHPQAFAKIAALRETELRKRVVGNYVIIYRLRTEHVEVLRVLHAARDIATLLDLTE